MQQNVVEDVGDGAFKRVAARVLIRHDCVEILRTVERGQVCSPAGRGRGPQLAAAGGIEVRPDGDVGRDAGEAAVPNGVGRERMGEWTEGVRCRRRVDGARKDRACPGVMAEATAKVVETGHTLRFSEEKW